MKKLKILCMMIALMLVLTGCSQPAPATQPDAGAPDAAGVSADVPSGTNAPVDPASADSAPADDAIVINGDTLIYEDEYCAITARFTTTGIIAGLTPKSDLLMGVYLSDVYINGHRVDTTKYPGGYNSSDYTLKFDEAFGFRIMQDGQKVSTPMSALEAYIDGWQKGDQAREMSFTLHVINIMEYPSGAPNVAVPMTLRMP